METDYFDIVAGVLQRDTLAPYFFIIYLDYMLKISVDIMKDNGLNRAKERCSRYPAQTFTDKLYANGIALLGYTPAQAKTQLHNLEEAAGGIGHHTNAGKMEYMWFN